MARAREGRDDAVVVAFDCADAFGRLRKKLISNVLHDVDDSERDRWRQDVLVPMAAALSTARTVRSYFSPRLVKALQLVSPWPAKEPFRLDDALPDTPDMHPLRPPQCCRQFASSAYQMWLCGS